MNSSAEEVLEVPPGGDDGDVDGARGRPARWRARAVVEAHVAERSQRSRKSTVVAPVTKPVPVTVTDGAADKRAGARADRGDRRDHLIGELVGRTRLPRCRRGW